MTAREDSLFGTGTMRINKKSRDYLAGFKAGYAKAQDEMRDQVNDFMRKEITRLNEETEQINEFLLRHRQADGTC
jgi:flagellar biosynthesis/type III secretory pathway protein FliH